MGNDTGLTASDVALLTGNRGNNGFGGDIAWVLIFLLFGLGGWGNRNGGLFGGGGSSGEINPNYITASDSAFISRQIDSNTQSVERKLDYVQEQICNSDATRANQIAGVNENLFTLQNNMGVQFAGVNQGISNNRYETQLAVENAQNGIQNSINALSSQQAQCCCDNKILALQNANALQSQLCNMNYDNAMALNGINYNMATNTNGIQNAISNGFCTSNYNNANNTRDIVDAINASARATQEMITANRVEDLRIENDRLRTQLNNANLSASQARQTNDIVEQLRTPTPIPAYQVANPYCNCNNGCGCGNY